MSLARSLIYSLIKMPLPFIPSYVSVKGHKYYKDDLVEIVTVLSIQEYMERLGQVVEQSHVKLDFVIVDDNKPFADDGVINEDDFNF